MLGKSDSAHLAELPKPRLENVSNGRAVRVGLDATGPRHSSLWKEEPKSPGYRVQRQSADSVSEVHSLKRLHLTAGT